MSLTVAIPTLGRPSLARCMFSFIEQLVPGDRVLFVADPKGDTEYVKWCYGVGTNKLGVDWRYTIKGGEGGWGQPQRNHAYDLIEDGYVWCLSDDDIATPTALDLIRAATNCLCEWRGELRAGAHAHCPIHGERFGWFIFRAGRATDEPWMWADMKRGIAPGNLDADCIVAPASTRARWGLDYEGDVAFARALRADLGEPAWHSSMIAVTKPGPEYLAQHYRALSDTITWSAVA
jgi:hypothetical protein